MKKMLIGLVTVSILGLYSCDKPPAACNSGYTGTNCATQITPTQIQVTKISITNFPSTNPSSGNDWNLTESSGHADIYPTLSDSAGNTIYTFSSVYLTNASNQNVNTFTPGSPIILSSPLSAYSLTLYNHNNATADDNMGSATQVLYNPYGGFPSTITLSGSGVTFVLSVQYVW